MVALINIGNFLFLIFRFLHMHKNNYNTNNTRLGCEHDKGIDCIYWVCFIWI